LVRRICGHCKTTDPVPPSALQHAGFGAVEAATTTVYKGAGCERCNRTGYRGRVGLYEVMEVTDGLRELILWAAWARELRRKAVDDGMLTLRMRGLQKVRDGVTSLEEVLRETVR